MNEPVRLHLIKNTSAFYRMTQSYLNERLKAYDMGSGQQFFLDRIARNPGISLQELAHLGYFDNGTATRAVQKLVDKGFVRVTTDEKDRRIRRLQVTEEGLPALEAMRALKRDWRNAVMQGFTEEEKQTLSSLLERLVENAQAHLAALEEQEEQPK